MGDAPRDIFPQTRDTWIGDRLDEGDEGRHALNHHVMTVYAAPLRVYYLGTSYRSVWDPDDIIQGFFANRLDREKFLHDWRASGKRLRRWLINAFLFYLKERYRQDHRHDAEPLPEGINAPSANDEANLDRAWAVAIVREAWSQTAGECDDASQKAHWEIFHRHHMRGQPYTDIATDYGVTAAQATVMARTVTNRFRRCLRSLIARDGVERSAIDREIQTLLSTLRS